MTGPLPSALPPVTPPPEERGGFKLVLGVLVLLVIALLSGCRTVETTGAGRTAARTVEVVVPVAVPCPDPPAAELPPPPKLPLASITDESSEADVVKAYAATVRLLLTDNIALRLLARSLLSPSPGSGAIGSGAIPPAKGGADGEADQE